MKYRYEVIKYEDLILLMIYKLYSLGLESSISFESLVKFKALISEGVFRRGKVIKIDTSPKIRKKFEEDYGSLIYTFKDGEKIIMYSLNHQADISFIKNKLEFDLLNLSKAVYEILVSDEILIESINSQKLKLKKRYL